MTLEPAGYTERTLIANVNEAHMLESTIKVCSHRAWDNLRLDIATDEGDEEMWITPADALKLADMLREMATS